MANIFLLSILFLVIFLVLAAFKRPKRLQHRPIPSPPRWPIIGNLHQLGELQHQSLWNLSKKYGPVMLLKLGKVPTVILSSSETARQALRDNDLNCCSRPPLAGTVNLSISQYIWKKLTLVGLMSDAWISWIAWYGSKNSWVQFSLKYLFFSTKS